MKNKSVYISYAAEDVAHAKWLSHVFKANGLDCYLPDRGNGGMENMTENIDKSDAFVLLYSNHLKNIDYSSKETEYAFNAGKCIFPVIIGKCSLEGQYSYYLTRFDRFELYKSRAKNMRLLIGQIKNAEAGVAVKNTDCYDVSLLSEEDIDKIIAGEKKHSRLAAVLSPNCRLYSDNPTVKFALKCFAVIAILLHLLISSQSCSEVSNNFLEMTMGEPFNSFLDLALIAILAVFFYVLWNLSYFPSVYIAKLHIKNRFLIAISSVIVFWLFLIVVNFIGSSLQ